MKKFLILLAVVAMVYGQNKNEESEYEEYGSEEYVEEDFYCEDLYGFFAHDIYCDKYWSCENGTATLKECGNGLMFDDRDNHVESCNYDYIVPCGNRNQKADPISTPHCKWLYGVFHDVEDCTVFWSCWNGVASRYQCSAGLAYDNKNRICTWAHEVKTCKPSGNSTEQSGDFACEDQAGGVAGFGHYSRHPHPTDCRKFYVCVSGKARSLGCERGQVFSADDLMCKKAKRVPGCEDYYKKQKRNDDEEDEYDDDDEYYDSEEDI